MGCRFVPWQISYTASNDGEGAGFAAAACPDLVLLYCCSFAVSGSKGSHYRGDGDESQVGRAVEDAGCFATVLPLRSFSSLALLNQFNARAHAPVTCFSLSCVLCPAFALSFPFWTGHHTDVFLRVPPKVGHHSLHSVHGNPSFLSAARFAESRTQRPLHCGLRLALSCCPSPVSDLRFPRGMVQ